MKKLTHYFALFLLLIVFSCNQNNKEIIIGVNLPLTGKLSYYGNEVKNGLSLAKLNNKDINIDFKFEDNQSLANNSVTVFNKLKIAYNPPIIISSNSPLSLPLRPLAEKNKVALLALVTGSLDFGKENIWCFRDAINQDQEGIALSKYVLEKTQLKKCASLVVNDDYGLGGANSFANSFKTGGGEILIQETFEMDEKDMRTKILKLFENKPEFIFLVGREQTLISSINQIRERDNNIPIITSDAFESPTVINGLGKNSIGIIFASYYNNFENEQGKKFLNDFKSNYGNIPGIYAVDAFVAGEYLINLLKQSGNDSQKFIDLFSRMNFNSTIKGNLIVNEKRDVISNVAVYRMDENFQKIPVN